VKHRGDSGYAGDKNDQARGGWHRAGCLFLSG
jgi:hypothetical protein